MSYKLWTLDKPGKGTCKEFDSWWDLIGWIAENERINGLSWNDNDVLRVAEYHWNGETQYKEYKVYWRNLRVMDEFGRIIPPSEIRAAVKEYKPRPKKIWWHRRYTIKKFFTYRFDPVPCTGGPKASHHSHDRHTYKNTWVKIADTVKGRGYLDVVRDWDRYRYSNDRNWKRYRKTQYKAS